MIIHRTHANSSFSNIVFTITNVYHIVKNLPNHLACLSIIYLRPDAIYHESHLLKHNQQLTLQLCSVLRQLKDKYHHCLNMCKTLEYQATFSSSTGKAALELIAPDKLIYDYAIEMCQTAALEELFGQPEECFERYQIAQILLHGLLHQINQNDKLLLEKYKSAVEKRLISLQYHFNQQQQQILGASTSSNASGPFGQKNSSRCSY